MTPKLPTLFLDLDNTLCECGAYYLQARADAAREIAHATGMNETVAYNLIEAVDTASIAGPNGFGRQRYPTSFHYAANLASQIMQDGRNDNQLAQRCFEIGDAVFTADYALYPGVRVALRVLRQMGYQLVITTKGEQDVQTYKVDKHNLRELVDHVFISLTKTPAELRERIAAVNADPFQSYVIGDSPKDDAAPAIEVGLRTILVDPGTNKNWAYSKADVVADHYVATFADVPAVLGASEIVVAAEA